MLNLDSVILDLEDIKNKLMEISRQPSAKVIKGDLQALCRDKIDLNSNSMFESIFSNKWGSAVQWLDLIIAKANGPIVDDLQSCKSRLVSFIEGIIDADES